MPQNIVDIFQRLGFLSYEKSFLLHVYTVQYGIGILNLGISLTAYAGIFNHGNFQGGNIEY